MTTWLMTVFFGLTLGHYDKEQNSFLGDYHWRNRERTLCDTTANRAQDPELICVALLSSKLFPVQLELLNYDPMVFHIHNLANRQEQADMIASEKKRRSMALSGSPYLHTDFEIQKNKTEYDDHKVVNTTQIVDNTFHASISLKKKTEAILGLDPMFSEDWQVLSYPIGGQLFTHYDIKSPSDFEKESMASEEFERFVLENNRVASLLVYLKTAKKGGGTVFPYLGFSVRPEPGDALLWFNVHSDGTKQENSAHGGCPIYEGTKYTAVLWFLQKGQEFRLLCPFDSIDFDITSFQQGILSTIDVEE